MVGARVRRQQVEYARRRGLSCRRACALLRVARSSLRYESRLAAKDAPTVTRMRELAAQYPRYGYRRIRIFLGREGYVMGTDRAHRLWRRARLQIPRRRTASTSCCEPSASASADAAEPGVGVRLRVRHVRERPATQVPDAGRRVDARGAGDRRREQHPLWPSDRGAVLASSASEVLRATCAPTTARSSSRRPC